MGQPPRATDDDRIAAACAQVQSGGAPLAGASSALVRELGLSASPDGASERAITDDQTNVSVVVGEQFIVKWFRRPASPDRGSQLVEHLAAVGFTATPALLGRRVSSAGTLASVHRFLPDTQDGWTWCIDETLADLDSAGASTWPAAVGRLAGELAVGLATPSTIDLQPLRGTTSGEVVRDAALLEIAAAATLPQLPTLHGRVSDGRQLTLLLRQIDLPVVELLTNVPTALIHADLHVGQILRWANGLAVVDFDGDPARPDEAASPLPFDRDLAHLLVSVELVGSAAAKRRDSDEGTADWTRKARSALLESYRATLNSAGLGRLHYPELLALLELSQLAREYSYAVNFLPRFAYASAEAVRRRLNQ